MVVITESELVEFREKRLSPGSLLPLLERFVRVLLRLAVGVGKSHAVDQLLSTAATFARFDLVICVAPTWDILHERAIVKGESPCPVPWTVLRPRPVELCGTRAPAWEALERRGCSAYGRSTLCRPCQAESAEADPCFWPQQLAHLAGVGLVFCTEQQFMVIRSLLHLLRERTGAKRVLVILDEARLLDASFEMTISRADMDQFRTVLTSLDRPKGLPPRIARAWISGIKEIARAGMSALGETQFELPSGLNAHSYKIQEVGIRRFGAEFRYLGYELLLFCFSRKEERWTSDDGVLHFIARPYLGCHLLVLSAHLRADYVAHRLGISHIASPFERTKFCHTGTRALNLHARLGADCYFGKNMKQVLDSFAVLIARNLIKGRTTVLISRKKSKRLCVEHLAKKLATWGLSVQFEHEDYGSLPNRPDPRTIPVLHYGILGVNNFSEYECAYCLNSYYVSDRELNQRVQDSEPERFRVRLKIVSGSHLTRRVTLVNPVAHDRHLLRLGDTYLRQLEVHPVIQAVGRVRFMTRPREVVFFQMHDVAREVGSCQEIASVASLRRVLGIPSAREIDEAIETVKLQRLVDGGATVEQAGARLGISERTAFRRLGAGRTAKNPLRESYREFGSLLDTAALLEMTP